MPAIRPTAFEVHGITLNSPPDPSCCSDAYILCPKCARQALAMTGNSMAEDFDIHQALDEWDDDDDRWDAVLNSFEGGDDDEEMELDEDEEEAEDDDEEYADDEMELEDDDEYSDISEEELEEEYDSLMAELQELEAEPTKNQRMDDDILPPSPEYDYADWARQEAEGMVRNTSADANDWLERPVWPDGVTRHSSILQEHDRLTANSRVPEDCLVPPDADAFATR